MDRGHAVVSVVPLDLAEAPVVTVGWSEKGRGNILPTGRLRPRGAPACLGWWGGRWSPLASAALGLRRFLMECWSVRPVGSTFAT